MLDKSLEPWTLRLIDHLVQLSTLRDRDALLHALTRALADTVAANAVAVWSLVQDDGQRYWLPLTRCNAGAAVETVTDPLQADVATLVRIEQDPLGWRAAQDLVAVVAGPADGQPHWRSVYPVASSDAKLAWGVVSVESKQALTPGESVAVTRLLRVFASMLDMLDYSERDALTGLWNRKSFEDLFFKTIPARDAPLPPAIVVDHRTPSPTSVFWLAMMDIDHFKQVNDRFGHLIGDEVLILVARLMRSCFRSHDRVFRFGGEEFVMMLRCPDPASATAALERFRTTMASYDFPQVGQITASMGFTRIGPGDSPVSACERADKAVYHAKRNGRNQVCSESDLIDRGLLTAEVKVGDFEIF